MTARRFFPALTAALMVATAFAGARPDQCLVCHSALGDKASVAFARDIHRGAGISCAGCHGGDPSAEAMEAAMDPAKGFLGIPKGDAISGACARCHSDSAAMASSGAAIPTGQREQLRGSVHGKMIGRDGNHVMQCTTCHGSHGIVRTSAPASPVHPTRIVATCTKCHASAEFMRAYNPSLAVDQLEKYRTSVHGVKNATGDTKTAHCASCHGSHAILGPGDAKSRVYPANLPSTCAACHSDAGYMAEYGIPTDQYEKFARSVHGAALLEKHDLGAPACNSCHGNHGAVPPGVASISNVCGTCHALNAELFGASPHKAAFDLLDKPECETCHGNHEILPVSKTMLHAGDGEACGACHSATENPRGYAAAITMYALVDSLDRADSTAAALVDEAEQKGMEISEAKFRLRDVRQARLETRTAIHAFSLEKFHPVVQKGLSVAAGTRQEAEAAIGEHAFRRIGLGVSTLIITVLVLTLYAYLRRIERQQRRSV